MTLSPLDVLDIQSPCAGREGPARSFSGRNYKLFRFEDGKRFECWASPEAAHLPRRYDDLVRQGFRCEIEDPSGKVIWPEPRRRNAGVTQPK